MMVSAVPETNATAIEDLELQETPLQSHAREKQLVQHRSRTGRLWGLLTPDIALHKTRPALRATSYLDGLRGVAAFIVYIAHSQAWNHDADEIQYGYGYRGHYAAITLPFLRVFITGGHAAVAVFFVISGYVLSCRPLALIHKRSDDLYPALASAIFRRGIRLYFPFVAVTILFFTSWHVFGTELEWPKPQPTFLAECANWWSEFSHYINPLKKPDYTWFTYDFPLWTIPVEFQGSLLIFISLLALSRVTTRARTYLIVILALYFHYIGIWQMFCFLSGLLLAELDLATSQARLVSTTTTTITTAPTKTNNAWFMLLCGALYLASQPSLKDPAVAAESPGWQILTSLVPTTYMEAQWWRFWPSLAAPALVLSISRLPVLKGALEMRFCQYLGRISFALYLVHIPVAITIGDKVFRVIGFVRPLTPATGWDNWIQVPDQGPLGMELNFIVAQMVILPVTLYLSELATKLFDETSITLSRLAYEAILIW